MGFEEEYTDVLQNIEFGIMQVYRQHTGMVDWDAQTAVDALIQAYNAELRGKQAITRNLNDLSGEVIETVKAMCEWRLGRAEMEDEDGYPFEIPIETISVDEIVACLKRIRKSIKFWSKKRGRQGYLDFVDSFFSEM